MPRAAACAAAAFIAAASLSHAATAADCARAGSRVDQALCTDPALKAAEDAMVAAFEGVVNAAVADARPMIRENQRLWADRRHSRCDGGEAMSPCLLEVTTARTAYLTARPENGPGITPPMVPDMRAMPSQGESCGTDISVYRFAPEVSSPAAPLLDANVAALFAGLQSNLGPNTEEQNCSFIADGRIAFAAPETVNLAIEWIGFPVGSYSDTGWHSIFADLKSGTLLAFADLFGDEARAPLAEACTASLRDAKIARLVRVEGGPENADMPAITEQVDYDMAGRAEQIAGRIGDLAYWRVTAEGATVDFGFTAGMYMDGTFECLLPKALLQKVAGARGWVVP